MADVSTGIYVRARPDTVDHTLSQGLTRLGFRMIKPSREEEGEGPGTATIIGLSGGWCRVDVQGETDSRTQVLAVLNEESLETVVCFWEPRHSEYSYTHFRLGSVVESFSVGGSAMGDIKFKSEMRRVPLHEVVNPGVFVVRSLERLGISGRVESRRTLRIRFSPPARRGWLRALLGAAWPED